MGVPGHSSDEPEAVDRLKAPAGIAASWRLRRRIQQMGAERSRSSLTDRELGVLEELRPDAEDHRGAVGDRGPPVGH